MFSYFWIFIFLLIIYIIYKNNKPMQNNKPVQNKKHKKYTAMLDIDY